MIDVHANQPVETFGPSLVDSGAAVIWVHRRNVPAQGVLDLIPRLSRPGLTYLAPVAAGRTWYPLSFMAPIDQNEPYLTSAIARLAALVNEIQQVVPLRRIAVAGFSQGGCLASEFVCRYPARYGGLIAFSGGLIGPPGTTWPSRGSLDGTPVFLGCSDIDAHVPKERVDETENVLAGIGGHVIKRIYPGMGHVIADDEIEQAQIILDQLTADAK